MKWLIRALFVNTLVLYFAILVFPGLIYDGRVGTLLTSGVALTLLNRIVKPLIKLFLLPINLVTVGLFGWVAHVVTLFLLNMMVSGIAVAPFHFSGFESNGFIVPSMEIGIFYSYVLASVCISLIASFVAWVLRK